MIIPYKTVIFVKNNTMGAKTLSDSSLATTQDKLNIVAQKLHQKQFEAGVLKVYRDERCEGTNEFIHQYPDGHEELVAVDANLKFIKLRDLY
ncbi:hypothetical protein GCM10011386_42970 [Parapedobacter defluvii]|uniref:Uncharacterized protein n=2 Tax=Parapedobacter defluvii TaxID=2045106 RepID=A0ABQ1MU17_9SPHI|nr:hypothetical protein GCM10011386_42970 [Parapedobacter defluvii]